MRKADKSFTKSLAETLGQIACCLNSSTIMRLKVLDPNIIVYVLPSVS